MRTLLISFFALIAVSVSAQIGSAKQVSWTYSSKKIADKTYQLLITATIHGNFHLYATKAGIDGPIPTTLHFTANPLLNFEGGVLEKGKRITKYESAWGGTVNFFEKTVTFIQNVKARSHAKTHVNGKIEFMVCNDDMCLPPAEITFKIPIGG